MKAGFVDYVTWWGPYLVGVLAMAYAFLLAKRPDEGEQEPERMPVALVGLLAALLLIGFVLVGALGPAGLSWRFAVVFLIGGLCALGGAAYVGWRGGPAAQVFFALGLALLETAFLRNYFRESPVVYLYVNALGAWLVAAVVSFGAAANSAGGARTVALATAAAAAVVAMGAFHYRNTGTGSLYGIDLYALGLLLAILATLAARACAKCRAFLAPAAAVILLVLVWWLGRMLGSVVIDNAIGGLCGMVGAAAVIVCWWLAVASGESDEKPAVIGGAEARVLTVLVAVAAVAMCMRWLGGYGIALAAVGGLAVLPFIASLTAANLHPEPVEGRGHSAGSPSTAGTGVVSALASVALVRALVEATSGGSSQVDIFESYTIPGLVLGGCLALMISSAAAHWRERGGAGPIAGMLRGVSAVALTAVIVFGISYFWRGDAVSGLSLGIAAGTFYLLIVPCSQNGAELVPGLQVLVVTLVPAFLAATTNLTRGQKIHGVMWTLGVLAVVVILTSAGRLMLRGRQEGGEHSRPG